jgi:hypothetical protein
MNDVWGLYLILGMFPAFILFAAIVKYVEVLKARNWSSVPGRIVISTSEARKVRSGDNDTEPRTFAKVVFEYKVAGKIYRGDRVGIGEDLGNFQVAETLAKYPVGKLVTVFYNPNRREQAVLERDLPPFIWKGIAVMILVLVGLIVGGVVGVSRFADFMRTVIPNATAAPFFTGLIVFSLVWALFVFGFQRSAVRARQWPTVPGRIESSGVRTFDSSSTSDGGSTTMYRAEIIYSYEVAGVRYTADKSKTGTQVSSNVRSAAERAVKGYPAGRVIDVHYNPDNPADAAVDPRSGLIWLLYIVPIALLAFAYFVAR